MSAVMENTKTIPGVKRFMEVTVRGKVEAARRHQNKHYTRLITPASDVYSRPQVLEIRSNTKLGQRDDEVTVDCKLGGYTRKAYRTTDKESGEVLMITPVDMTLDAVE